LDEGNGEDVEEWMSERRSERVGLERKFMRERKKDGGGGKTREREKGNGSPRKG